MNNLNSDIVYAKAKEIHANNVVAGWWTDLKTGESILESRNRAELLMLVVSEVSEADFGRVNNLNDDKLPHLPMFYVELADVAIRLFDMIGAEISRYGDHPELNFEHEIEMAIHDLEEVDWYRSLVNTISDGMEHLRKSRIDDYRYSLSTALVTCFVIAKDFDMWDVIQQKTDYNSQRTDHKIQNRVLAGGKKF